MGRAAPLLAAACLAAAAPSFVAILATGSVSAQSSPRRWPATATEREAVARIDEDLAALNRRSTAIVADVRARLRLPAEARIGYQEGAWVEVAAVDSRTP